MLLTKKKSLLLVSICLITAWERIGIAAQYVTPQRTITETVKLIPRPDAELILDNVEVKIKRPNNTIKMPSSGNAPNSSFSINISDKHVVGSTPIAYEIEYDFEQGTYSTRLIVSDETETISSTQALAASTVYWGQVRIQTIDPPYNPPFAVLAQTTNILQWTKSATRITYEGYSDLCWANPNTGFPFYTHWQTSSCPQTTPFYETTRLHSALNITEGTYINWDWNDPDLSTTATHSVRIQAYYNSNSFHYNARAWHNGEDAGLLKNQVYIN